MCRKAVLSFLHALVGTSPQGEGSDEMGTYGPTEPFAGTEGSPTPRKGQGDGAIIRVRIFLTKDRRRPDSKIAVDMDVSKDRCGSRVEKARASGERSASKGCMLRSEGRGWCSCAIRTRPLTLPRGSHAPPRRLGKPITEGRKTGNAEFQLETRYAKCKTPGFTWGSFENISTADALSDDTINLNDAFLESRMN